MPRLSFFIRKSPPRISQPRSRNNRQLDQPQQRATSKSHAGSVLALVRFMALAFDLTSLGSIFTGFNNEKIELPIRVR
jgi:hypothetical protein